MSIDNSIPIRVERVVQQALLDYAYKHRISPLYAAHCNLYKSLHSEGFLNEDDYQRLMQKFTAKLVKEQAKPMNFEEQKKQQKLDEKNRLFASVLSQWDLSHKVGWRESWIEQAEFWREQCPEAKRLLELVAAKVFIK